MPNELRKWSREAASLLARKNCLIVFAESCTGGLVAASLAQIPGISNHLCGSAVTYQDATKRAWLRIDEQLLIRPGPVSSVVARRMAEEVLANTPHADISASITGHLGPRAPARLDGVIYIGIASRTSDSSPKPAQVRRFRLTTVSRHARQREAATIVLTRVCQFLKSAAAF